MQPRSTEALSRQVENRLTQQDATIKRLEDQVLDLLRQQTTRTSVVPHSIVDNLFARRRLRIPSGPDRYGDSSATVTSRVAASVDDGYAACDDPATCDTLNVTNVDFTITGRNGSDAGESFFHAFYRFLNITVPQKATILSAKLTFVCKTTNNVAATVFRSNVYCERVGDAVAPTNPATFNAIELTSAFAAWDNVAVWTAEDVVDSADITAPVQEVVNLDTFQSGNAMMVLWKDDGSDGGDAGQNRVRIPYDYRDTPAKAVLLTITYLKPGYLWIEEDKMRYSDESGNEQVNVPPDDLVTYEGQVMVYEGNIVWN